ncbi:Putative RING-H2 finger protein ATL71 [Linum grandiflorum]
MTSDQITKAFPLAIGLTIGSLFLISIFISLWFLSARSRYRSSLLPNPNAHQDDTDDDEDDVVIDININDADLSGFPKLIYNNNNSNDEATSVGTSCAICLAEYLNGDILRLLPDCHHVFHAACVDQWLLMKNHSTCPICRRHSPVQAPPPPDGKK